MMPYITIVKVRKFHQSTRNRFGTTRKKPVGGTFCLNRLNSIWSRLFANLGRLGKMAPSLFGYITSNKDKRGKDILWI